MFSFVDMTLTMAGVALIAVILDLRARTKTVPSAEERDRWRQTQAKGYCDFVLRRGIMGCGVPIMVAIGIISLGAASLTPNAGNTPRFSNVIVPDPNAIPVQAHGEVITWSQLGMGLVFVMIPSLLLGAYFGDRLWQMSKSWTDEEPKNTLDQHDQI